MHNLRVDRRLASPPTFKRPLDLVQVSVCSLSGMVPDSVDSS